MKVVIIGSGNVANVLGKKIRNSPNEILQIAGRNEKEVSELSALLNTDSCFNINEINPLADLYIVAISDKALPAFAKDLKLKNQIVVHTAGVQPINLLESCSLNYGVVYPLQTLHKTLRYLPDIPLLINGNNAETIEKLTFFSSSITGSVSVVSEDDRLKFHLAAVFANNFSNHLFALANRFCDRNNLNFDSLKPLIKETCGRLSYDSPGNLQTGPAFRKDFSTIEKHKQLLQSDNLMSRAYEQLTDSIITFYKTT